MKKLQVVALAIFSTFILTSCTDDTELLEKENEAQTELEIQVRELGQTAQFIDKDDIEEPNDRDKD
ncbi:hypothetical protein [Tenacibaculum dicentrarchi]|uniref:hypothetical protein n=1 Tax=Tenacibaculum dicentrarchi TaxID=669041 RepID=UPI001BEB91FC|nr:hypothetical protein [Tenacibaculum dicentrarchi]MCD8438047.1 hypothetical protein [Tenacibaculum dicentrarchi]MCD8443092.1 hypothetical protein [Tenacibaculum dicentrarchi]